MAEKKERDLSLAVLVDAAHKVAELHRRGRVRPADECPHDSEVSRALGDLTTADYRWRQLTQAN